MEKSQRKFLGMKMALIRHEFPLCENGAKSVKILYLKCKLLSDCHCINRDVQSLEEISCNEMFEQDEALRLFCNFKCTQFYFNIDFLLF